MNRVTSLPVQVRAALIAAALTVLATGVVYAADAWSPGKPWWCYPPADACGKWASDNQYIGPTYSDCIDLVRNGWESEDYVQTRCNNGGA